MKSNKPQLIVFAMLAATTTVIACSWSLLTEHSVRFNAYRTGAEFYTLPPLPIMYDPATGKEIGARYLEDYYARDENVESDEKLEAKRESERRQTWEMATVAMDGGDLVAAKQRLEKYLDLTAIPELYTEPEHARRNAAYDILDAMTALRQGSSSAAVMAYEKARSELALESANVAAARELADSATPDKNLADNWDYLRASILYHEEKKAEALAAFEDHAIKYPRSEKRESALYMAAKLTMQSSHSFDNTRCGIGTKASVWYQEIKPEDIEPVEKCRDESWQKAMAKFDELAERYPNGRYADDVRGWRAYLLRRGGERGKALAEYYRMLGHPTKIGVRIEAKKSIQMLGHDYDDATLDEVEKLIAPDANASLAYAYHRIYNHAIDLTHSDDGGERCWDRPRERQKKTCAEEGQKAGRHELERVASFASAMIKRYPAARVSGAFTVRVAEANLELKNYAEARSHALRALSAGVHGDHRAEALWVKGSAEHEQRQFAAAKATFTGFVSEYPKHKLTSWARRLLAMNAEDMGDLESAIDHYIALEYDYDVAYFIDVLMPTDRLAKYVAARSNIPERNELTYALGVRYMREKRWDEARATLRKVETKSLSSVDRPAWDTNDAANAFPKEPRCWNEGCVGEDRASIGSEWIDRDLKTIDTIEYLERAVFAAPNPEASAEANYQLASFYFAADDLLLYNPAAWQGARADLLHDISYFGKARLPGEGEIVLKHSQQHDTMARAIEIYIDTATRFPNTRAGRDALYSAAVAHERLSNINNYWREAYQKNLFAGPRMVTYADVKSAYPKYQLPRGTDGWEPATRTVNGGPGWAAPPKPAPKLTRREKVKRELRWSANAIKTRLRWIGGEIKPKIEKRVDAGIAWYEEAIRAAIYGVVAGVGLWAMVLFGIRLHLHRRIFGLVTGRGFELLPADVEASVPPDSESRVDRVIVE